MNCSVPASITTTAPAYVAVPGMPTVGINCSTPSSATATVNGTVSWNAVSGATSYRVSTDGTNFSDAGNVTSVQVQGLAQGASFTVYVKACSAGGCSAAGSATQAVPVYKVPNTAPAMPAIFLTDGVYQGVLSTISSYQQQMQNYVKWLTNAGYDPCNEAAAMAKLYSQGFLSDSALENTYIYMANILNEIVGMIEDINNTSYVGGYVGSQMGFSVTTNSSGQVVVTNSITGFTATIGC